MTHSLFSIAGSDHNLDLNLGISTPSSENGPKENANSGHLQFISYDRMEDRRVQVTHKSIYMCPSQ